MSARNGKVSSAIVDAFRKELSISQATGMMDRSASIMVNLGAALLNLANAEVEPAIYSPMYSEVEDLMTEALLLTPDDEGAQQNLQVAHTTPGRPPASLYRSCCWTIPSDSDCWGMARVQWYHIFLYDIVHYMIYDIGIIYMISWYHSQTSHCGFIQNSIEAGILLGIW